MEKRPCLVCGQMFTPITPNAKYCGKTCADIGSKTRRSEWEKRTGYLEKKRIEAQQRRDTIKAAAEAERQAAAQQKLEERERRRAEEREQQPENELSRLLDAAEHGNRSLSYWQAYRDYDLKYAADNGFISGTEVNGIPTAAEDFAQLVCESIAAGNRIIERVTYERRPAGNATETA